MKKMIIAFVALATIILTSCGNPMMENPTTEARTITVTITSDIGDLGILYILEGEIPALEDVKNALECDDGGNFDINGDLPDYRVMNGDFDSALNTFTITVSKLYMITYDASAWVPDEIHYKQYIVGEEIDYPSTVYTNEDGDTSRDWIRDDLTTPKPETMPSFNITVVPTL